MADAGGVMKTLAERCTAIELVVVDVDGVLTDGGIEYNDAEQEHKRFHVRDGSALKVWRKLGKRSAIITGRNSKVVALRGAELDVDPVIQGSPQKMPAYRRMLDELKLTPEQVCYVGDDLPDLPPMGASGLAVAVADACPDVRAMAHYITSARGGHGAVREAIEMVIRAQGLWEQVLERFEARG